MDVCAIVFIVSHSKIKMRIILISLLVALVCFSSAYSQPLKSRKWDAYHIPIDSLQPYKLTFYDSAHGYFLCSKDTMFIDSMGGSRQYLNGYAFETSDGGKTWVRNTDTNLVSITRNEAGGYISDIYFANVQTRYMQRRFGGIRRSDDYGKTWKKVRDLPLFTDFYIVAIISPNILLAYDESIGIIVRSYDGGVTFPTRLDDGMFQRTAWPDTSMRYYRYTAGVVFAMKDKFSYSAVVLGYGSDSHDTSELN